MANAFKVRRRTDVWHWEWGVNSLKTEKITTYGHLERHGWFLLDQQARYDACRGHEINFVCFSPCLLSSPAWPRHSYQSTSLSSDTAFCLPALASPPLCLPTLLQSPTRLQHWDLRVSVATSCLLDQSCRLLRRDPLSGASLYWQRVWRRACHRSYLAKRFLRGLFVCRVCWFSQRLVGYIFFPGDATVMAWPGVLGRKYQKRERGILIGINNLKLINFGSCGFYCRRNGGGLEIHCWNCCHCHRWSGPEDEGEARLCSPYSLPLQRSWNVMMK